MNFKVVYVAIVLVAALAFIKTGDALQCWDCSSDQYGRCADHFNISLYPRTSLVFSAIANTPRLMNCDSPNPQGGFGGYGYQQRQACMKRVETDRRYGRTTYSRGCHTLVGYENVGTCPTQTTYSDITVDFCEYCDTHECNGAQGFNKRGLWMALVPTALALLLRK